SIPDLRWEPRQPVAAHQGLARGEIELPVVPIAGEHMTFAQHALAQRIAFVRTAVRAGEDTIGRAHHEVLAAVMPDHRLALGLELSRRERVDPRHGPPPSVRLFAAWATPPG